MIVYGQPSKGTKGDTICVSEVQLRKLLIGAEQKKLLEGQIDNLNARIANYQQIIEQLNDKDSATVEAYKAEIKTMQEEKKIYQDQIAVFEKLLRKEKRRRFWAEVSGVTATAVVAYLYLTK